MTGQASNFYSGKRVKRGFLHFIAGKTISSIASFFVAILIVRELPVSQFAEYTAISGLLITLMLLSNLGIERTVPKYLSQLKEQDDAKELKRFTYRIILARIIGLFVAILFVYLFSNFVFGMLGITHDNSIMIGFFLYAFAYGMSMNFTRILHALLKQKQATIGMSVEWFTKLGIISFFIINTGSLELVEVIFIQGGSIYLSSSVLLYFVIKSVSLGKKDTVSHVALSYNQVYKFSLNNYFQSLSGIHCTASTNKLLGASLLAASSVASLGFAYSIIGVFKRYLPSQLFLGLIEPMIMGRFSVNRNFDETRLHLGMLFKINLLLITPIAIWVFCDGSYVFDFITNDKYGDSAWLISVLLVALVLESQRAILLLVANAIDQSHLLFKSNLYSLVMLPSIFILSRYYDIQGFTVGVLLVLICRNFILESMLRKIDFSVQYDVMAILKIIAAVFISEYFVSYVLPPLFNNLLINSVINLFLLYVLYLAVLLVVKPFSPAERNLINNFLGRKLFFW